MQVIPTLKCCRLLDLNKLDWVGMNGQSAPKKKNDDKGVQHLDPSGTSDLDRMPGSKSSDAPVSVEPTPRAVLLFAQRISFWFNEQGDQIEFRGLIGRSVSQVKHRLAVSRLRGKEGFSSTDQSLPPQADR